MKKKPSTPMREIRRKYEETHKDIRKERNMTWGTSIDRKLGEEINKFLEKHNLSKVDLINAGYRLLKESFERNLDEIDRVDLKK